MGGGWACNATRVAENDAILAINRHKKEFNDWGKVVTCVQTKFCGRLESQVSMEKVFTEEPVLSERQDVHLKNSLLKAIKYIEKMEVLKYEPVDCLGRLYEMYLSNGKKKGGGPLGEFYTPYGVCRLMAEVCVRRWKPEIDKLNNREEILAFLRDFKMYDPTCGSGGMLLVMAEVLEEYAANRLEVIEKSGATMMSLPADDERIASATESSV